MNHTSLLNYLVSIHKLDSYCEIGLQNAANNFNKIQCKIKYSVDPDINAKAIFKGTSDEFFKLNTNKCSLFFIDGLHTADQVERDFNNSLKCLNKGGRIVIHDCLPENEIETCIPRGNQKKWMGDVYKFIFKLNSYDGIDFCTYNFDFGCCVVWKDETKIGGWEHKEIDWQFYKNNLNLLRIIDKIA